MLGGGGVILYVARDSMGGAMVPPRTLWSDVAFCRSDEEVGEAGGFGDAVSWGAGEDGGDGAVQIEEVADAHVDRADASLRAQGGADGGAAVRQRRG